MLDYNNIAALDAVVREGGFEKAGRVLHISQSAVTQRIRQLEELSGQVLLVRSQPPAVTDPGRRLLEHFKKVRLLEMELEKNIETIEDVEKPVISLAVNSDSLATWFSSVIRAYMAEDRGFLHIRTADQDVTHRLLSEGDVMGCITASPSPVRGCRILPLGKMIYRFVCTRDFADRYFPDGVNRIAFQKAPKLNFNKDDCLLSKWVESHFPGTDLSHPCYYVPSSEQFPRLILSGSVCGMITNDQFREFGDSENLVDLSMGTPVETPLYWQRWALESQEMDLLGEVIHKEAGKYLT